MYDMLFSPSFWLSFEVAAVNWKQLKPTTMQEMNPTALWLVTDRCCLWNNMKILDRVPVQLPVY